MTDEITKYLREDEKPGLPRSETAMTSLEERLQSRLAECRRLMAKHEWTKGLSDRFMFECLECGATTSQTTLDLESAKKEYPDDFVHTLTCLWAQAIDTGRK